jgi:hypothetical protein
MSSVLSFEKKAKLKRRIGVLLCCNNVHFGGQRVDETRRSREENLKDDLDATKMIQRIDWEFQRTCVSALQKNTIAAIWHGAANG